MQHCGTLANAYGGKRACKTIKLKHLDRELKYQEPAAKGFVLALNVEPTCMRANHSRKGLEGHTITI